MHHKGTKDTEMQNLSYQFGLGALCAFVVQSSSDVSL